MKKKCVVFCVYCVVVSIFVMHHSFSMEQKQKIEAYVQVRGCELCGIKESCCSVMHIVGSASPYDEAQEGSQHRSFCPHSSVGPYQAISNLCKKSSDYGNNYVHKNTIKDELRYSLQSLENHSFMMKECLFIGDDKLLQKSYNSKRVATKIMDFFKKVERNKFDICVLYDALAKRWGHEFVVHVFSCGLGDVEQNNGIEKPAVKNSFLCRENSRQLGAFYDNCDTPPIMAFSYDGLSVAIGFASDENNLFLCTHQGAIIPLMGHVDPIARIEFSKNSEIVVSVSKGFFLNCIVWDGHTGKQKNVLIGQAGAISTLALSDDARYVVTVADSFNMKDKKCIVWDVITGEVAAVGLGAIFDCESLELTKNNRWLIGNDMHTERLTELWRMEKEGDLDHVGSFLCVASDQHSKKMALAHSDGIVRVVPVIGKPWEYFFNGKVMTMTLQQDQLFLSRYFKSGFIISVCDLLGNTQRDIFAISSLLRSPYINTSLIMVKDKKVLFGVNNCFVLGIMVCKKSKSLSTGSSSYESLESDSSDCDSEPDDERGDDDICIVLKSDQFAV